MSYSLLYPLHVIWLEFCICTLSFSWSTVPLLPQWTTVPRSRQSTECAEGRPLSRANPVSISYIVVFYSCQANIHFVQLYSWYHLSIFNRIWLYFYQFSASGPNWFLQQEINSCSECAVSSPSRLRDFTFIAGSFL